MRPPVLAALLALAVAVPLAPAAATPYTFTSFSVPGRSVNRPRSINDAGQVVGYAAPNVRSPAFNFVGSTVTGVYTQISPPPDGVGPAFPTAINDAGQVVGTYASSSSAGSFLFDTGSGTYTELPYPGALAISNNGLIAGAYPVGSPAAGTVYVFSPTSGSLTPLSPPGDAASNFTPRAINDAGEIVGTYADSGNVTHSFVRDPVSGAYTVLLDPLGVAYTTGVPLFPSGDSGTDVYGVNDAGLIVGTYFGTGTIPHGFVLDPATGVYTTLDDPASTYGTYATGINGLGQVVGYYDTRSAVDAGLSGFVATPAASTVPEPSTAALLGLGMAGFGAARHRSRELDPNPLTRRSARV